MEILDTYCLTVLVARQVSSQPNLIPAAKLRELLTIKQSLGLPDARFGLSDGELDARSGWRPAPASASNAETEALVRRITDEVVRALWR
jgi:L-fuculose-phosphate aldolase